MGFFTLDLSSRSYFFAERIDRLSEPIRRRRERSTKESSIENDDDNTDNNVRCYETEPLMTPRRLRSSSCITIQRAWRIHTAELQLTNAMIHSWNIKFHCYDRDERTYIHGAGFRQLGLRKAIRAVGCWWIAEGLHIEDNWITLAWENDVFVGNKKVRLNFDCEATLIHFASHQWDRRKLSLLIVKAGLKKALRGEKAAEKVIRWYRRRKGKLQRKAMIIQRWIRLWSERRQSIRCEDIPSTQVLSLSRVESSRDIDESRQTLPNEGSIGFNHRESLQYEQAGNFHSDQEYRAAITIQSWFRVTTLKSAIQQWPSTMGKLRSALKTAGSTQQVRTASFDEFDAARNLLCSSMIAKRLGDSQFPWLIEARTSEDFVAKRAATLAIHNIVRAYLVGLKKFRDKKRATLIQATFRGYIARKQIEAQHFAAVIIQFAWSNNRYLRVKIWNAVIIQRFWRMAYCQRNYRMLVFCIVFLQANWRRAIARQRFLLIRDAALLLQRTWRGSGPRKTYLRIRSSISTLQYSYRRERIIAEYQHHCIVVSRIQVRWRGYIARLFRRRALNAIVFIQSHIRRSLVLGRFAKLKTSATIIQSRWRGVAAKIRCDRIRNAIIIIQADARRMIAAMKYHEMLLLAKYNLQVDSSVSIQSLYRGHAVRSQQQKMIRCATMIQAMYRMRRCLMTYKGKALAIVKLQALHRGVCIRILVSSLHVSATTIQRLHRGHTARLQTEVLRWTKASEACTKIQSQWRGSSARDNFARIRIAVISVQSFLRMNLERKKYHYILMEREHAAAICMQKLVRGNQTRIHQSKLALSVTHIQSVWRGKRDRWMVKSTQDGIILIQSLVRGFIARRRLQRLDDAAICIQRFWRRNILRAHSSQSIESLVLIQSHVRGAIYPCQVYRNSCCYNHDSSNDSWFARCLKI